MRPSQHRPTISAPCRPRQPLPRHRRHASAACAEPQTVWEPDAAGPARRAAALRDVYGSRNRGVEDLALLVAQVLDVTFVFRTRHDLGEHYDHHGGDGELIEVKQNIEDDDGELMEPAHLRYRSFVYVTQSPRAGTIAQRLARIDDVELVRCELVERE